MSVHFEISVYSFEKVIILKVIRLQFYGLVYSNDRCFCIFWFSNIRTSRTKSVVLRLCAIGDRCCTKNKTTHVSKVQNKYKLWNGTVIDHSLGNDRESATLLAHICEPGINAQNTSVPVPNNVIKLINQWDQIFSYDVRLLLSRYLVTYGRYQYNKASNFIWQIKNNGTFLSKPMPVRKLLI